LLKVASQHAASPLRMICTVAGVVSGRTCASRLGERPSTWIFDFPVGPGLSDILERFVGSGSLLAYLKPLDEAFQHGLRR
jgi:hypothetical protein